MRFSYRLPLGLVTSHVQRRSSGCHPWVPLTFRAGPSARLLNLPVPIPGPAPPKPSPGLRCCTLHAATAQRASRRHGSVDSVSCYTPDLPHVRGHAGGHAASPTPWRHPYRSASFSVPHTRPTRIISGTSQALHLLPEAPVD